MRRKFCIVQLIGFAFILLGFTGCSKTEPSSQQQVVVYTSLDKLFSHPILEAPLSETGGKENSMKMPKIDRKAVP